AGWSRPSKSSRRRTPSGRARGDDVASKDGRATLATVAASAGVSIATVSKVVNGRTDVGPETRARVETLLKQHDYVGRRADGAARGAARPSIELVFEHRLNAYGVEIIQGILETAAELRASGAISLRDH